MRGLELEDGLVHLRTPSARSPALYRVVCDRLAETDGRAYWIDARNAASTHALYDRASSRRPLERLRVARAFTAYQHHSLARAVARAADGETSLIVAPNVVHCYDDLPEHEREDLLAATLATLRELGRALACPVLATTTGDEAAATVDEYADADLECRRTREGYRFEGDGATETGYYRGSYWQTTIPYWVDLYGAVDPVDPVVAAHDRGVLEVTA